MNLFGKKKPIWQPTGFVAFLNNDRKYHWVTEYIDDRNEIREGLAFADMQQDSEIGKFTMPKFKKLVAKLYAQYLQVNEDITTDGLDLLAQIDRMPLNITIRRVKPKASGNNWSVQYLKGTVYYGKTLPEALKKLQDRNPKVAAKFAGPEA